MMRIRGLFCATLMSVAVLPAAALAQATPSYTVDDVEAVFGDRQQIPTEEAVEAAVAPDAVPAEAAGEVAAEPAPECVMDDFGICTVDPGNVRGGPFRVLAADSRPRTARPAATPAAAAPRPAASGARVASRPADPRPAARSAPRPRPVQSGAAAQVPPDLAQGNMLVTFAIGSATLTEAGRANARVFAEAMTTRQSMAGVRLVIEGHTDAVGDAAANLRLSERRAQAVKDFLVQSGVPEDRLSAVGLGETQPSDARNPNGAVNRRVLVRRMP